MVIDRIDANVGIDLTCDFVSKRSYIHVRMGKALSATTDGQVF